MPAPTRLRAAALVALVACFFAPSPSRAQGWIEPLVPTPNGGVERLRTNVVVRVTDRVAEIEVEEWFRNNGGRVAEGSYLYPIPGEAVFSGFSLFQGEEELRGETIDRDRARAIYEEIVRRNMDPALIELVGQGMLRARVFPIQPGETRQITLKYTQVLRRAGDVLELRYLGARATEGTLGGRPMPRPEPVPMPRPAPGRAQTPARPGAAVPQERPAGAPQAVPLTFAVTIENDRAFMDPYSPTHEVRITRGGGRMVVRPVGELAGNFLLMLPPAGEPVSLGLITNRPSSEDGTFMLTLSPSQVAESAMPKDLTVVADVSGSMSGQMMEQTRRALIQLLGTLGPQDRFRLISFSSGVTSYRLDWTPARPAELQAARVWVERLRAEGSTNISGALTEAFRATSPEGRLPVVVFLTDGLPTVGETNAERIAQMAERQRARSRVFAFGLGYDVDTYLLDRLTQAGRGSVHYVTPEENVETMVASLAAKIQHPVLTDLALGGLPVRVSEVYPTEIPDLFAGEELTLMGRYSGTGSGTIRISGTRDGRPASFDASVTFPAHELENDFLPRLWASRKIGELTRAVKLNGPNPEVIREIQETALRYGLLSDYTAHLVTEPNVQVSNGMPMPAAPPPSVQSTTGQGAVAGSAGAAARRQAGNAAAVAAAEAKAMDAVMMESAVGGVAGGGRGDRASAPRVVAGRAFLQQNGVWVDRLHTARAQVVKVKPFSRAYFDLLAALPELKTWWGALSPVVVAGRQVSLEVSETGVETLPAAEVQRLTSAFRASK
jgi:Ca-activated chloride channel homolog